MCFVDTKFVIYLDQELQIRCCHQVNHFVDAYAGSSTFKAWLEEELS
jgi:hypothetical protein